MPLSSQKSATLGEINVGLAAALGVINPLGAQIDALLSTGVTPFSADLSARLNAALTAQANLSLQVGLPSLGITVLLSLVAQLQAAFTAALTVTPPSVRIGLELGLAAGIAGSLSVQLGLLRLSIDAALRVKIPAIRLAAELAAEASAGPAFVFSFQDDQLSVTGDDIRSLFNTGLDDGTNQIAPTDTVGGVVLLTKVPSVQASLFAIIQVP